MITLVAQLVEADREIGAARVVPKRVVRIAIVENMFAANVNCVTRLPGIEMNIKNCVEYLKSTIV